VGISEAAEAETPGMTDEGPADDGAPAAPADAPRVLTAPAVLPGRDGEATLLVVEADRWRLIQDLLGTAAAEVVARHLVQCVQSALRPVDRLFRTGSGQVLVLLPDTGHAVAERIAGEIARALESRSFTDIGPVTMSGAIAQRYPGESVGQWWKRLDSTLAQAKVGGGNHVMVDRRRSEGDVDEQAPGLHLEWQSRFECGEPTIDRQHRELFELSEDVLDAARRRVPLAGRLQRLVACILEHFESEEAILTLHGYQDVERHAQSHARLFEKARRMQAAVDAGRATREDLLRFLLGEVVADHMLSEDRQFAQLFSSNRPAPDRT
jgi:hemerythrin-like metal-binding protein/diguanylate cyclase (GGDEF)-like protein